jgi:hypothetical protein
MANQLLIEKQTGGYFKFTLNNDSANAITSIQNDLLAVGSQLHFKTGNGANIIKEQFIYPEDVTIISGGVFTFTTVAGVWDKLIEIDYFAWLGGGGDGVDRFDDLLDTFQYNGNAGKVAVVDNAETKLVPITLYNKRLFTELEDTPSDLVPDKMVVVNPAGTALILQDQPEPPEQYLNSVGYFDYEDFTTSVVPLSATSGVAKKLTNDTEGVNTSTDQNPYGVSFVWDFINNQFNFSELTIGDTIDVRIHIRVTTTTSNQKVEIKSRFGIGSASQFETVIYDNVFKSSGVHEISFVAPFYLGSLDIINSPAELYLTTDANATIRVYGWYVRILRKNINIITVDYEVPDATTLIKGILRLAGDLSGTANNPTVPELANKVPSSRTITINGETYDLSANRSWTIDGGVTSVFGRTGDVIAVSGDYTTSLVTEGSNLYFTNARSRSAISLTTTGTSGSATYDSVTGVLNIPNYEGGITLGTPNGLSLSGQELSLGLSSGSANGALSSTDWTTFNNKQNALNGTGFVKVTGTNVSYDNSTYVPTSRTININGNEFDLSANRAWSIPTHNAVSIGSANGLSITSDGQVLSLALASAGSIGALSASDWMLFNSKIGGSGTSNYLPKFTGASSLDNSQIFDSGTSVGIGVIPKNWDSLYKVLQISDGALTGTIDGCSMSHNLWQNGETPTYITSRPASSYSQNSGNHYWDTAPSGTANNGMTLTPRMILTNSGNVGIGTTSPNVRTEIAGTEGIVALRVTTDNGGVSASNYSEIQLADNGTVRSYWRNLRDGSGDTLFSYNLNLRFLSGSTERMRITSSGNVGIGTTSPSEALEVIKSTAYTTIYTGANGNGASGLACSSDNRTNTWFVGSRKDSIGGASGTDRFNILYNTNSILTATSGGNVGIGTTTVSEVLEVVKNQNATTRILVSNSDTTNSTSRASIRTVSGSIIGEMVALNSSSVFLGTASNHDLNIMSNGSQRLTIYANGNYQFYGSNVSDARAKENINSLDFNAIEKIIALQPKSYYMKNDNEKLKYGFIAQEVYQVLPDLVNGDLSDDGFVGLDYNGIIPFLVKAIQELKAEIEILKNK